MASEGTHTPPVSAGVSSVSSSARGSGTEQATVQAAEHGTEEAAQTQDPMSYSPQEAASPVQTPPRGQQRAASPPNQLQLHAQAVREGQRQRALRRQREARLAPRNLMADFEAEGSDPRPDAGGVAAARGRSTTPPAGHGADDISARPAIMPPPAVPRRVARAADSPSTPPRRSRAASFASPSACELTSPGTPEGESEHSITAAGASSLRDDWVADGSPQHNGGVVLSSLQGGAALDLSPERPPSPSSPPLPPVDSRQRGSSASALHLRRHGPARRLAAMATTDDSASDDDTTAQQVSSPDRPEGSPGGSAALRSATVRSLRQRFGDLAGAHTRRPTRSARARALQQVAAARTDTAPTGDTASVRSRGSTKSLVSVRSLLDSHAGEGTGAAQAAAALVPPSPPHSASTDPPRRKRTQGRLRGASADAFLSGRRQQEGDAQPPPSPIRAQPSAIDAARAALRAGAPRPPSTAGPATSPQAPEQGVAAGAPALPRALLPLALGMLVRFSAGLDTVMHMQWRRRGRSALLTFDMLKPSVQAVVRHTFSQGHLEELAGVAPDLYRLSTKCMNASGQPVVGAQALDKRTWRVVVEWPGGEAPSQITLTHRRRAFAKAAWDVARTAHRAFLRTVVGSVPPAVATHRAWHPHFKVDAVPIPRAPVAPPPAARPAGARDLLAAATTTPTLTRALQAAAGLPLSPPRSHKRTASAARLAHHPGSPAKAPRAAADMTTPVRVAGNSGVLLAGVAGGREARKGGGGGLDTGTTLGTHTTTTSVARALAGSRASPAAASTATGAALTPASSVASRHTGLCEGEAALLRAGRRVHTGTARPASARERASRLLVQRPHQHHPSDATTEAGSVASATGASLPPELAFLARAAPQLLARSQRRTEAAAGASTAQAKAASRAAALSRELPPLLDAVAMQFIQAKRSVLPLAELVEKLGAAARNSGAPRAAAEIRGNLRALAAHSNGWASIVQVTAGEFFRIQRSADAQTMKDVRHRISHIDASALLER